MYSRIFHWQDSAIAARQPDRTAHPSRADTAQRLGAVRFPPGKSRPPGPVANPRLALLRRNLPEIRLWAYHRRTASQRSHCSLGLQSMAGRYADYYSILGVKRDADFGTIRSAFRHLARRYHPDVSKGRPARKRFLVIREAYEVLSDPEKRREYDRLISKPIPVARKSAKGTKTPRRGTVAATASFAPARGFRLVVDVLGILRLDLGAGFGGPSQSAQSHSRRSRAQGPKPGEK